MGGIADATQDTVVGQAADWVFSAVMGLVEGLSEFLPVSSTGHLIVTSRLFGRADATFEIAIQLGAITAIVFLYWDRIFGALRSVLRPGRGPAGRVNLIFLILAASVVPGVLGVWLGDRIETLLFNEITVGVALIVGGVLFLVLESWQKRRGLDEEHAAPAEDMTLRQAFWIGVFESLALIPGTSRSGATIAGAMVLGFKRTAAAEFSFLIGLPVLYGACLIKLYKEPEILSDSARWTEFAIASVVAFVSAALVVRPFIRFLQQNTFVPFAWYRIFAGSALLIVVW